MSDFWKTRKTIGPNKGYALFSLPHIAWLFFGLAVTLLFALIYRQLGQKGRKRFQRIVAVFLILNILAEQIQLLITNQWEVFNIPLNFCFFSSYIIIAHALLKKDNDMLAGLTYGIGIPGAVMALLTPDCSVLPLWNFSSILSYTFHITLIMYSVCLIAGGYVPRFKDIRKAILPLILIIAAIYGINKWLGTDFFYINGGAGVPWIAAFARLFEPARDLYVLVLFPVLIAALWTAFYLPPYLIVRHSEKKKAAAATKKHC